MLRPLTYTVFLAARSKAEGRWRRRSQFAHNLAHVLAGWRTYPGRSRIFPSCHQSDMKTNTEYLYSVQCLADEIYS